MGPTIKSSHTMLRIAFLHPDLGLGGAERLVVDAASGLAKLVSPSTESEIVLLDCWARPQRT